MKPLHRWLLALCWWFFFAAVIFWDLHPISIAITFVVALRATWRAMRPTAPQAHQPQKTNNNKTALEKKFGRLTPFVTYGSIGCLGVLMIIFRTNPTPFTFRLFAVGLIAFFAFGIYLCCLVAMDKHGNDNDHMDTGE